MKHTLIKSVMAASLLAGAALFSSSASAQTTYPMVCRGTDTVGPMTFSLSVGNNRTPYVRVKFNRGTGPASWGLQPGQCSWLDRGIGNGEPNIFAHNPNVYFDGGLHLGTIGTLPPMQYIFGGNMQNAIPYFPNYVSASRLVNGQNVPGSLLDSNTYFTFNAYNNGAGLFIITSIRCNGFCS